MRHWIGRAAQAGVFVVASLSPVAPAAAEPEVLVCTRITTAAQLQAVTPSGSYCLDRDIDLASVPNWAPLGGGGGFRGQFYGNGHVIKNLTLTASHLADHGLFGALGPGGSIQDVGLINATVNVTNNDSNVGALVGRTLPSASDPAFISNVYSTGTVTCGGTFCMTGGLIGQSSDATTVTDSWSSADVVTGFHGGGLVGRLGSGARLRRVHATGNVDGALATGGVGGLVGLIDAATVVEGYATGTVDGGSTYGGGLVGWLRNGGAVRRSYATGAVTGNPAGGLIGAVADSTVTETFSAGPVTSANPGGLVAETSGATTVSAGYWDTDTSGQATSAAGSPLTTVDMRTSLPGNYGGAWGITPNRSYPFLNDPGNFSSTLATLVRAAKIFAFLPIRQGDLSQYAGTPAHSDQASLATVYTMMARAIGITDDVAQLRNIKIDTRYWHDTTRTTTFNGAITMHATLGAMTTIPAATPLNGTNVIGQMNKQRLVILRGAYTKPNGSKVAHYMLGTLYTKSGTIITVVANDPWTGTQIEISPKTKKVITPGFPLAGFTVNGYQPVTTLN